MKSHKQIKEQIYYSIECEFERRYPTEDHMVLLDKLLRELFKHFWGPVREQLAAGIMKVK